VKNHQLIPLLDGLDKLGLSRQKKCTEKINEFLRQIGPSRQAVVCCRAKEYDAGEAILRGPDGAVELELQPLTEPQIKNYL